MTKKLILFLCSCLLMSTYQLNSAEEIGRERIQWLTNYDDAVNQGRTTSKPLLLLFTGSDWCSWCSKLEEEVLNTNDFAEAVGDKFIFVKIDFPLYSAQDPEVKSQNKQLQQKFDVRSFPTIILFDAQQNQKIGMTGYRPGGGKPYAAHLSKMVNDYSTYKQKMGNLDKQKFSGIDLKQLYEKAKELDLNQDANALVKMGMSSDQPLPFLLERYRSLAEAGLIDSQEAVVLRHQLLTADPNNERQIPYHVAIIQFESYCKKLDKEDESPEHVIAPLISYIEKFGTKDKENLWRLQMIISQVFLDKNQMASALKYAKASYDSAPSTAQPEISCAIQNIQSQIYPSLTHSSLNEKK
jgi:protein disulfide-isomerase